MQKEKRNRIKFWFDIFLTTIGIIATIIVILLTGFDLSPNYFNILITSVEVIIILFAAQEFLRLLFVPNVKTYLRSRWFELLLSFSFILNEIFSKPLLWLVQNMFAHLRPTDIIIIYLVITQMILISAVLVKVLRYNHLISKIQLHPAALFAISFGTAITIGSLLLMLPKATVPGYSINYIDALFTSTSAICVTGLVVVDTSTTFTVFGKVIIMGLIQIGGLGVMTITTFFALFFGTGLSYRFRILMKDLLSNENLGEVSGLLKRIALFTFLIEGIGALNMYLSLGGTFFPVDQEKLFSSVFHSVSAFCNAGFSVYSSNLMQDIVRYNYWFNSTVMFLIVFGGIGFTVIADFFARYSIFRKKESIIKRININSRIVVITTLVLIAGGAVLIYYSDTAGLHLGDNLFDKVFNAVFFSVSARTAGFNIVPVELISYASAAVIIVLMWIGASPNSTGGGIKTSTFTIAILFLINYIRGKEKLTLYGRMITMESVRKAYMIILSSLFVLCVMTFILIWIEPGKNPFDLFFEATSAMGTVGLSRNLTFYIGTGAKWILIVLMFMGRIGILSFFLAFYKSKQEPKVYLPSESIIM